MYIAEILLYVGLLAIVAGVLIFERRFRRTRAECLVFDDALHDLICESDEPEIICDTRTTPLPSPFLDRYIVAAPLACPARVSIDPRAFLQEIQPVSDAATSALKSLLELGRREFAELVMPGAVEDLS